MTALTPRAGSIAAAANPVPRRDAWESSIAFAAWVEESVKALPSSQDATESMKFYLDAVKPMGLALRERNLHATFGEKSTGGRMLTGGSPEVWSLARYFVNCKFRPTPDELAAEVRRILRIVEPTTDTVFVAPPAPEPIERGAGLESIIPDSGNGHTTEQLQLFANRIGTGDVERDSVMLRILAHLPTDGARARVMDGIEAGRSLASESSGDNEEQRTERKAARMARQSSTRRDAEIVARMVAQGMEER